MVTSLVSGHVILINLIISRYDWAAVIKSGKWYTRSKVEHKPHEVSAELCCLMSQSKTLSDFPCDFRFLESYVLVFFPQCVRQSTFTCSKSATDTIEQGVKQIHR